MIFLLSVCIAVLTLIGIRTVYNSVSAWWKYSDAQRHLKKTWIYSRVADIFHAIMKPNATILFAIVALLFAGALFCAIYGARHGLQWGVEAAPIISMFAGGLLSAVISITVLKDTNKHNIELHNKEQSEKFCDKIVELVGKYCESIRSYYLGLHELDQLMDDSPDSIPMQMYDAYMRPVEIQIERVTDRREATQVYFVLKMKLERYESAAELLCAINDFEFSDKIDPREEDYKLPPMRHVEDEIIGKILKNTQKFVTLLEERCR